MCCRMSRRIPFLPERPKVSVLRLHGAIGVGRRGLDDAGLAPVIAKAFGAKPDAVALQISCPGGSPVQSSLIGARIRRLSEEKEIPVFAFVEDVAASGGYWLASAADEIWVDRSTIVGSIGVISAGFGVQGLIERHGIERRMHTAGESKSFLDPFRPEKEEDVQRLERLLEDIHAHFIDHVKSRRGEKLRDDPGIFTGEFWLGLKGVELGLADGIGHMVPVMKEKLGDKARFRSFGKKKSLLQRFGSQIVDDAYAGIEERAAYARFGL